MSTDPVSDCFKANIQEFAIRNRLLGASILLIALCGLPIPAFADEPNQTPIQLPKPTGQYGVGTKVWHWQRTDESDGLLELMGQLWYPSSAVDGTPARYRPLGGKAFESVQQHAVGEAPFAALSEKARTILFCPGRGTNRYYYGSLAEDLASRGFAVFAVDIPHIGLVEYPDGRTIEPSAEYQPSFELITGPYEKVDAFFEGAVSAGLKHLELALDTLASINNADPTGVLTDRLDLQSIGAFGHSLGGRLCGALAGVDNRVVAFASMEGVAPREVRQQGMKAASLMLYSSELPEAMALPNIRELFDNRTAEATILRLEGLGHNSVTDQPLIFPEDFDYAVSAEKGLEISREILAQFFEAHLASGRFSPTTLTSIPEISLIETSVQDRAVN